MRHEKPLRRRVWQFTWTTASVLRYLADQVSRHSVSGSPCKRSYGRRGKSQQQMNGLANDLNLGGKEKYGCGTCVIIAWGRPRKDKGAKKNEDEG